MQKMAKLSLDEAWTLSVNLLEGNGFAAAHAEAIARSVVAAQCDECHSHGLYRLIDCVRTLKQGGVEPNAVPEIIDQAPSVVRVDAKRGSSLLAFEYGRRHLVEKTRASGVAILAVNNAFHFSALWPEVEALAEQGLVSLAMTPSHAYVAPAGGDSPLLGTNPIAFSWPRPEGPPFTFDFATSVVARGEVELHRRAGKSLPAGWALDNNGQPTTDPTDALAGALLPFGGHKGSALSIMIELLAGPLIGDQLGHQTRPADGNREGGPQHGEFILAIDPACLLGPEAEARLAQAEVLFEGVIDQGARLPSQRRHEARRRSQLEGVEIPAELYQELTELMAG